MARIVFEVLVAVSLVVAVSLSGSYQELYASLGTLTPSSAVNMASRFLLILATVHVIALVLFFVVALVEPFVRIAIDVPLFRLAHGFRKSPVRGWQGARTFFLSERALGTLVTLHSTNRNVRESMQTLLEPLVRWTSVPALALAALILIGIEWNVIARFATDVATGEVGTYVGSNTDTVVAVAAFVLSLALYVVLILLLFTSAGRRVRLRNNSEIVTLATQQLAGLDLRIYRLLAIADETRHHGVQSRATRAMWSVDIATQGRISWHDGGRPSYVEEPDRARGRHPLFEMMYQAKDVPLAAQVSQAVASVQESLGVIEAESLSQVCEAATHPIRSRLRTLYISFRPHSDLTDWRRSTPSPQGALLRFPDLIPRGIDRAGDDLATELQLELTIFDNRRGPHAASFVREPSLTPLAYDEAGEIHLQDLTEDQAHDDHQDLLERCEEHIRDYCENIDRQLIWDGANQDNLFRVSLFLNRHVLGGRMDTRVDRVS